MKLNHLFLFGLLIGLMLSANLAAEIPGILNYQGRLTGTDGSPIADGNYQMQFRIYGSLSGTDVLWSSGAVTVSVSKGLFNIHLGESPMSEIPSSVFAGGTIRYLGITIASDPELSPRAMICSGAYTYRAQHADTADYAHAAPGGDAAWTDDGTRVHLSNSNDSVGVGTDAPQSKLHVSTPATEAKLGQSTYGVYGQHFLTSSYGYLGGSSVGGYGYHGSNYGLWGGTLNGKGVYGSTSDNSGIAVYGQNLNGNYGYLGGNNYAIYGNAASGHAGYFAGNVFIGNNLGLGNTSPLNRLDVEGGAAIGTSYSGTATATENGLLVQGDVGIGLTNPNRKLYIAGSVSYTHLTLPTKRIV